ncbi:DUF4357 domain-containing protein [Deinococcus radiodurans]|uniref:DUF4357 domain-containing protein n=1 Tax=Deinococcus radiodurans (strain ATCC 13939 / DSM 20539 / JCM 16871 / CCUG 27074 / LMG 4051 / NBRC 15346 / NCIMB 9279 / VKM B-1422 / R1) TaxID=243230 RepID=Q9RY15_DEIRA|nr:DUF4357 domain-containing protein [Deinococcus radiodurans]AAF09731.1 hypothetical protein DR_0137 [Deinococcus radiodurans R1 = ATCC 13939 = DSM 20539]ANC72579.1 restriction endonuclease [Deinococcus radiodurans R1 = ATCC 13939 = DSM 20539]QEM72108.1 DUF4357 domain-containing protein [Deinococcus radiodurans]QIP28376.1 DUF4357 domain-containing protein [Deinococcus radiodurans]QIP32906.1 DUF4357 domain-containing protein [Deinococcus radiodurans]
MPTESVQSAVQAIQGWLDDPPGEAVVRQCIVLRLLLAAGFDIWNPDEVHPEETNVTGSRADFLVRRGAGVFALELKGMGATLQARDYQQALNYAVSVGTRWAIVTNGRVWVVLDERRGGDWEARVALKTEMGQEGHTFGEDLATLLDPQIWEKDRFEAALKTVAQRQERRRDEERIRREKRPLVEAEQARYKHKISFEEAADIASRVGLITEAERDVLLAPTESLPVPRADSDEIVFYFNSGPAQATATYHRITGLWILKAGSTARREIAPYAKATAKRREQYLLDGTLKDDGTILTFEKDVSHKAPSSAASDISGGSEPGWDVWKDAQGRSAQFYRPPRETSAE